MSNNIYGTISQTGAVSGDINQKRCLDGELKSRTNMSGNIMLTVLKGMSAYEIAKKYGFEGSEEEWINSLEATIELGTVTDGTPVSITNSGDNKHAIFDFVLPSNRIEALEQNEPVIFYCGTATEVV